MSYVKLSQVVFDHILYIFISLCIKKKGNALLKYKNYKYQFV
jgi:hypothetical protein